GFAFLLLGVPRSSFFSVVLFSAVAVGTYSFLPIFFSLPGEFLTGFSAAAGIALVTSVANFGGFVGPYTVGLIRHKTGSFYSGLICAGVSFLVSATLAFVLPKGRSPVGERLGRLTQIWKQILRRYWRNHETQSKAYTHRTGIRGPRTNSRHV